MRVDLPGGHWADIKGTDELSRGDLRAVDRKLDFEVAAGEDGQPSLAARISAATIDDMQGILLERVITAWSFELPVPVTEEILDQVPLEPYRELCKAIEPHMRVLRESRQGPNSPSSGGSAT